MFNSRHSCLYCKKKVIRIADHIRYSHSKEEDVIKAQSEENTKDRTFLFDIIRNKGDHMHNREVLKNGSGELLVSRRLTEKDEKRGIFTKDFSPCPKCYLYVKNLPKHLAYTARCKMKKGKYSKAKATAESNVMMEKSSSGGPSDLLEKETLSKFIEGEVSEIAKTDPIIIDLGNNSIRRNAKNVLKRGSYASFRMRMAARIMIEVRKLVNSPKLTWEQILKPEYFKVIVQAVSRVAGVCEKGTSYRHPGNALKGGHIIKEMINTGMRPGLEENI